MTTLSPPLQRRSRDTLNAISRATKKLLRTRSFGELTIQEIVSEANSSAGSFYARFKGKQALLHYLHEELAESSLRQMRDFIEAAEIETVTPIELADMLVPDLVRGHDENRPILRATLIESVHDGVFVKRALKLIRSIAELIAEHTAPTAETKHEHVNNIHQALGAILAILDQSLFHARRSRRQLPEAEIDRLKRIFLASLNVSETRS